MIKLILVSLLAFLTLVNSTGLDPNIDIQSCTISLEGKGNITDVTTKFIPGKNVTLTVTTQSTMTSYEDLAAVTCDDGVSMCFNGGTCQGNSCTCRNGYTGATCGQSITI